MKKLCLYITASVFCLVLAGAYAVPALMKNNLKNLLQHYGFERIEIADVSFQGNTVLFENISLDPDDFSTIETIRASFLWPDLLFKGRFRTLTIDNIVLTGELGENATLTFAGWNVAGLSASFQSVAFEELYINSARMDIVTSAGGIRLETKGQLTVNQEGLVSIRAATWGTQHQLKIDTRWTGHLSQDGSWAFNAEIEEGRLNLDELRVSRLKGWISVEQKKNHPFILGGQFTAGTLSIANIPFTNVMLTFEGTPNEYSLIAQSQIAGFNKAVSSVELQKTQEETLFTASFETGELDAFLSFITAVYDMLAPISYIPEKYKNQVLSILGTHTDRQKMQETIGNARFERLELHIFGNIEELAGRVRVKNISRNGQKSYHVISLDP